MKTKLLCFVWLVMAVQVFGQPVIRQATDSEVSSGADVKAFLNPRQAQSIAGSGPTNGTTASGVTNISSAIATNNYVGNKGGMGTNNNFTTPILVTPKATNMTAYGRLNIHGTTGGGQIGVDSIDVEDNSDLMITAEAAENWIRIVTGGLKVEDGNGNPFFIVDGQNGEMTGNGSSLTNIPNTHTVKAGSNISVSNARDAANGGTNATVAVADPMSLGQINAGTTWATNFFTPTNQFVGTVVDFNKPDALTNLNGNLTFTDVANVQAAAANDALIYIGANGADRQVTAASAWATTTNQFLSGATFYVTNGTKAVFWVHTQVGWTTNLAMLPISK